MLKKLFSRLKFHLEHTTIMDTLKIYRHFWTRTFNYTGTTHRWDFWVETIYTALIFGLLLSLNNSLVENLDKVLPHKWEFLSVGVGQIIGYIITAFQWIILLPEIAAIVRRVRSIGIKFPIIIGIIAFLTPFVSWILLLLPENLLKKKKSN